MSTAFVFAPLSSLLRSEDRGRFRHLAEVQARFAWAEEILRKRRGLPVCFDGLLDLPSAELCGRAYINRTAALIIAMQLGVVDRLTKLLPKPAWVAGCSLGDVARTVTAGVCAFDTALDVAMMSLDEVEGAEQIGSNAVAMTTARHPFTAADFAWFASVDLAVSRLSDRLLNISGLCAGMQQLTVKARQCHWRIFPLLDFPLHSRHVAGYTAMARALIGQISFHAPAAGTRVYSSVLGREVKQSEDFRAEFIGSLLCPHDWQEAANDLVKNHGVTRFVNIGPCRTLSRLLLEMDQEVLEADDLIAAHSADEADSQSKPGEVRQAAGNNNSLATSSG